MTRKLFLVLFLLSIPCFAAKPIGNPKAYKGGSFTIGLPSYPKSLVYYIALATPSLMVNQLVLETLVETHPETNELIPLLAKSWKVSKDKKTFTFTLDPEAKFSDGTPVTSADVKFTWDTILNPKNKTVPWRSVYASIESLKVIDKHTVEFKAKTLHFKNLEKVASLFVLPKHFFSKGNFNKDFNRKILGSGPYTISKVEKGRRIVVKRNPKYWGQKLFQNIGRYNFDTITFKSVPDYNVQLEMLKRGDIDYFYVLVSKMWARQMDGKKFKNNYIIKLKAENSAPSGTQGVAFNLKKPLFQDLRVRQAMQLLMDRDKWIRELMYNFYTKSTGVIGINSEYHPPNLKPMPYDPKKAKALLAEAGWKLGSDGILAKGKQQFAFDILLSNKGLERLFTVYQEDLKKMGIKMRIKIVDWATSINLARDRKFDAMGIARSRAIHPSDFATTWGSAQADIAGSQNVTSYKNPEVDKLAAQIDATFNKAKRRKLVFKVATLLAKDLPFAFTYERPFYPVAYWNRFSFPGKGYFEYSDWMSTFHYWWYDAEKDGKLKKAMSKNQKLS